MRRLFAVFALSIVLLAGQPTVAQDATPAATPPADCPTTTEAENEAIARQYQNEVLSKGNLDLLDGIWAEDLAHDDATGTDIVTLEEGKPRVELLRAAFRDLSVTVEEVLTEDDL
ncbi:MAG: ester cyclase, partial [Chloroflexota bacterium]|nr:ester cyclase [Chloroflexota bacterium]